MGEKTKKKHRRWLAVVAALVLLIHAYVLSYGPAAAWVMNSDVSHQRNNELFVKAYAPILWVEDYSITVHLWLSRYAQWCYKVNSS